MKGLIGPHQQMMLRSQLRHLGFLEQEIEEINKEIATRMASVEDMIVQFDAIPGVGRYTAEDVLAEMGLGYEPISHLRPSRILGKGMSR